MINPATIIFAIQSGIKLGRRINRILIDKTHERSLPLPLGWLVADVQRNDALSYFKEDNRDLIKAGGPYVGLSDDELVEQFNTLTALTKHLNQGDGISEQSSEILQGLQAFEQTSNETNSAVQQILGTIVDIGVDYFGANPGLLAGDSSSKRVLSSFIANLDTVNFSDDPPKDLVSSLLFASLRTLDQNVSLVDDDERLQSLIGGITSSLIDDYEVLSVAAKSRRNLFIKRVASSILRGGAEAFNEDVDLFIKGDTTAKKLVQSTLSQVVAGIDGKEDLFTNESLELIYKSALGVVSENSNLFTDNKLLTDLIKNTVSTLSQTSVKRVFKPETFGAILQDGLEAIWDNIETLIDIDNPRSELLANTIKAVANGLSGTLAGGGAVKDLLSKRQLVELAKISFQEVAKNPEVLLAEVDNDKRTALAQIIGSLAKSLGDKPQMLMTGGGFLELIRTAVGTAVLNADKLLDLDTTNVKHNVLFQVVKQAADAVLAHPDPRKLVGREVFLDIVQRSLPIVSANLDGVLGDLPDKDQINAAITKALDLASGTLQNRINGANLPELIQHLLKRTLRGKLNLSEESSVRTEAIAILNAA